MEYAQGTRGWLNGAAACLRSLPYAPLPATRFQPGSGLQAQDSRLRTPGIRLQAQDSRNQTPGIRLQAQDSRLRTPGSGLQAAEAQLQGG